MVIPAIHEISTVCSSVGKLVNCGDTKGFCEVWIKYSEESIIGSFVRAVFHAMTRNREEAVRICKGFIKAAIRFLFLGGLLIELPVFKQLDALGRYVGDLITEKK